MPVLSQSITVAVILLIASLLASCGTISSSPRHGEPASPVNTSHQKPSEVPALTTPLPILPGDVEAVAAPLPDRLPDGPVRWILTGSGACAPITLNDYLSSAPIAVRGHIARKLPARWALPEHEWSTSGRMAFSPEDMIAPVVVELSEPPLMNHSGADLTGLEIVIATLGGEVGAFGIEPAEHERFAIGEEVIVLLSFFNRDEDSHRALYLTEEGFGWHQVLTLHVIADTARTVTCGHAFSLPVSDLLRKIDNMSSTPIAASE